MREVLGTPREASTSGRSPRGATLVYETLKRSPPAASSGRVEEPRFSPSIHKPRERSQWERIALTEDFELHIRRPLSRDANRRLERLLEQARRIFEEES